MSSITAKAARGAPVKAMEPMNLWSALAVVLAPALEKCVTDRTATRAPSAISYRFEHTADLGIFVRVSFAEIGRYRVDNDQHHVADGGYFLFQ